MADKKGLEEVLKSARERIETEQRQRQEEKAKYEKKVKEFWGSENNLYEEKGKLYFEILAWRDEFVLSPQCTEIFKLLKIGRSYAPSLTIFGSSSGHEMDGDNYGYWSKVILEENRELQYVGGYKMGSNKKIKLEKDPTIAKSFTHEYLCRFHDSLYSNEVYERIKEEIEQLARL